MQIRRHLAGSIALTFAMTLALPAQLEHRLPSIPPGCEAIVAPAGNTVSLHAFAFGVQIYRWNATNNAWDFVAPAALLCADDGFHSVLGIHYAGPTWETNDGSNVVGSRVAGCSPVPTAIPWLLLRAVSTQGPGPLLDTTFIQRVNTTGGLAPARAGSVNEVVGVPYTAEYYFYRAR